MPFRKLCLSAAEIIIINRRATSTIFQRYNTGGFLHCIRSGRIISTGIGNQTISNNFCSSSSSSSSSSSRSFSTVPIKFHEQKSGKTIAVDAEVGTSLLDVSIEYDIDIEGACGGEMACSTCHVILSQKMFDRLPEKEEEEEDMLDLAWGVTDT